jgi:short-subunit dehydrogenase
MKGRNDMKYKCNENPAPHKELIVITGCDTGIGKSLAEVLIRSGYSVALSYLNTAPFDNKPNLYQKKLDLLNAKEIDSFCQYVKSLCHTGLCLKAVVSNAGVALGGPVENLPMSVYRNSFEINYFAALTLIKSLIPQIIENAGRIIIVGSNAGKIAMPFLSPYASTKYAIEGFTDSLRRELKPFGVYTILLEPASIATPIWNKAKQQDISFIDEKYIDSYIYGRDKFVGSGNKGLDTEKAAIMIADIMFAKRPKARYIISKRKLVTIILQMLPDGVMDMISEKYFRLKQKH